MIVRYLAVSLALAASLVAVAGSASAAQSTTAARAAAAPLADPAPECNGANASNCWEYYSWYWTYGACHDAGRQQLANNPGRYDDYNCAGDHGAVVWLWLHRVA